MTDRLESTNKNAFLTKQKRKILKKYLSSKYNDNSGWLTQLSTIETMSLKRKRRFDIINTPNKNINDANNGNGKWRHKFDNINPTERLLVIENDTTNNRYNHFSITNAPKLAPIVATTAISKIFNATITPMVSSGGHVIGDANSAHSMVYYLNNTGSVPKYSPYDNNNNNNNHNLDYTG